MSLKKTLARDDTKKLPSNIINKVTQPGNNSIKLHRPHYVMLENV